MYPTKSTLDYMTEMNRLFPRNSENDLFSYPITPNTSQSLNQSSLARSSSSTDTSPDSFPDMTAYRFPSDSFHRQYENLREHNSRPNQCDLQPHQYEYQRPDHRYETPTKPLKMHDIPFLPQQMYETPRTVRHQRPIVGRKIMASTESQMKNYDVLKYADWPDDSLSYTPPKATEQKFNQNMYYELFPSENKGNEFKTSNMFPRMSAYPSMTNMPNKMNPSPSSINMCQRFTEMSPRMAEMSPRMAEMSPRMAEMSPRMTEMSPSRKVSPGTSTSPYSQRFSTPAFKEPMLGPKTSYRPSMGASKMCTFCRKNGETPLVYMTHTVREKVGTKNIVTCPILRSHVCSTCGASGDDAHTITYCPVLRSSNNGQPLQSTTITLKNTRVKSNGRRRY